MRKTLIVLFSVAALLALPTGAEEPATCDLSEDSRNIQKYYNVTNKQNHPQCFEQDCPHNSVINNESYLESFLLDSNWEQYFIWFDLIICLEHIFRTFSGYQSSDTPGKLLLHFGGHASAAALFLIYFASSRYNWTTQHNKSSLSLLAISWSNCVLYKTKVLSSPKMAKLDIIVASIALTMLTIDIGIAPLVAPWM